MGRLRGCLSPPQWCNMPKNHTWSRGYRGTLILGTCGVTNTVLCILHISNVGIHTTQLTQDYGLSPVVRFSERVNLL